MIRNYLLVALRGIWRSKLFSLLNTLGLALGMASALLIFFWINDELNVDQFHANGSRLYRVLENQQYTDGRLFTFASTPGPMAPYLKENYPEIEKAARFTWPVTELFHVGDKRFYEEGRYTEQDFLDMFSFGLVEGDVATALHDKHAIVISKKMAEKFFGDESALGKVLLMGTSESFTVTGVLAEVPAASSLKFDFLLPFEFFWDQNKGWLDRWDNNNIRTYLLLRANADQGAFGEKFKHEIGRHVDDNHVELFLQRFGEAYLHGDFENGQRSGGRIEYVRIFFLVAVFVLLIACINFMNLATAQASKRAKEVGLRKVVGAAPRQLFRQFMSESFLTVLSAAAVAIGLVVLFLPVFNNITGKSLSFHLLDLPMFMIFVAVIAFTTVAAGSYPALVIAAFQPAAVLKGQLKSGHTAVRLRKALVIAQFTLSIVLIICTVVVYRQLHYMENRDIGFERDNLVYVWMEGDVRHKFESFRTSLLASPAIEAVTATSQLPIEIGNSTAGVQWEGKDAEERILFTNMNVDYDFIQTMRMGMVEGRPFDRGQVSDSTGYIVNEKAAAKFGFVQGTAGQELTMWDRKGRIVGVVKDFNFGSLHHPIEPLILRIPRASELGYQCVLVRVKPEQTAAGIRATEDVWRQYAPGYPFKYSFLNQDWENLYKAEGQRGRLFNAMAILSIFISCLGLFGLSAFAAERRTKELGVRKVLGASVPSLMSLMGREFLGLVFVASVLGCAAGWYVMDQWLGTYAFHVEVGWLTLLSAAAGCLAICLITVAFHAWRASAANPAKVLRWE
ncbi:MAG: ABC transporter permease [Cyclobacteriaceae bacterium]|jgi:predicted permease|nr:ABC transporter permease [Cyclobacteriaceae bacterium]